MYHIPDNWYGKPYYSLDAYCKTHFHHKCYKIALNAHMTCPNRDGSMDTRGCIFCSAGGSGDFAVSGHGRSVAEQLQDGARLFRGKRVGSDFIAYFQAYTNTYAPLPYLEQVFREALICPDVCGISIATRPDCLPAGVLALLGKLKTEFADKFIWVELGLQTIHEDTARLIRRGYTLCCFEQALYELQCLDIPVIVHTILGLPGEDASRMLSTIRYLNARKPFGIKLQLLHVLRGTDLADMYLAGDFEVLTKDAYLDLLMQCLSVLSPDIVVHRVTGDGPKKLLLAPAWSANKRDVLNSLHRRMQEEHIRQGCRYQP